MIHSIWEFIRRVQYFAARHRIEAELHEEMNTHLAMLTAETGCR